MGQSVNGLSYKQQLLEEATEALKKQNKDRRARLVAFLQNSQEISESTKGRHAALWERNLSLWKKTTLLFGDIKKVLQEEPDLWKEDLRTWKEKMALWKEELDRWEERFSGRH